MGSVSEQKKPISILRLRNSHTHHNQAVIDRLLLGTCFKFQKCRRHPFHQPARHSRVIYCRLFARPSYILVLCAHWSPLLYPLTHSHAFSLLYPFPSLFRQPPSTSSQWQTDLQPPLPQKTPTQPPLPSPTSSNTPNVNSSLLLMLPSTLATAFSFSLFYSPRLCSGCCHPPDHPVKKVTWSVRDGGS